MTHNLEATVFVYRNYKDKTIKAEYIEKARLLEDSPDWDHVATLEPRMWIECHYAEVEALAQPEQEPVAHCEAGPEYCWKCNEEIKPTYGSEEIRKLREVNKHLADHIVDANKMVEALREIGDFSHDNSTGPAVPDALWKIRSMAYDAMESTPPQRKE